MSRFGPALRRARRLAGVAGVGVVGVALGLLLGGVSGWFWLRSTSGNAWIRLQAEALAQPLVPGGSLAIGGLSTDLATRLSLSDVALRDAEGDALIQLDTLELKLAPWALLSRTARVRTLELDGLAVDLTLAEDGTLDLLAVLGLDAPSDPSAPPWAGLPGRLLVEHLSLRGVDLTVSSGGAPVLALNDAQLSGALDALGTTFAVRDLVVHAPLVAPGEALLTANGQLGYEVTAGRLDLDQLALTLAGSELMANGWVDADAVALQLDAKRLDLAGAEALIGPVGLAGALAGSVRAEGPLDAAVLTVSLGGLDGVEAAVSGAITVDALASPVAYTGSLAVGPLDVAQLYPAVGQPVRLAGTLHVDAAGFNPFSDLIGDVRFDGGEQQVAGLPLGALDLRARVEAGVVTLLPESRVLGLVGDIAPEGSYTLATGQLDAVASGTVDATWLRTLGAPPELGGSGRFTASISGNALAEGLPAKLGAVVTMAPLVYGDDVVIDRAELRFDGLTREMTLAGGAQFEATGARAYGVSLDTISVPDLAVSVGADGAAHLAGNAALGAVIAGAEAGYSGARLSGGQLALDAPRDAAGALAVVADLTLDAFDLATFPGSGGVVHAELRDDTLDFSVSLVDRDRALLTTNGDFAVSTGALRLHELLVAPTPRLAWVSDGPVRATFADGGVRDAELTLVGLLGELSLTGALGLAGPVDATLTVTGLELDAFAELFPEVASGTSGKLTTTVTVSGDASAPYWVADIDARGLWFADSVRWLDLTGRIEAHSGNLYPALVLGVAGEPLADVSGRVPADLDLAAFRLAPERDVELLVGLRPGSWERLQRVTATPLPLPQGRLSGELVADGPLGDPDFRFAGVAELVVPGWTQPGRAEIEILREGGELDAFAALREGFTRRATLGGAGETRLGEVFAWAMSGAETPDWTDPTLLLDQMVVSAVLLGVPVRSLMQATGASLPLEGEIVGGVSLFGSPWAPELEGGVHWLGGRIGRIPVEGAYLSVVPGDGGLDVDLDLGFTEGGFKVAGKLPFSVDLRAEAEQWVVGDLDLAVSGEGLPLAVLDGLGLGVEGGTGTLVVNGNIGGSPLDPDAHLVATMADGGVSIPQIGIRAQDMTLDLAVDGRRVRLGSFKATTSPLRAGFGQLGDERVSRLSATGSALIDPGEPAKFQAKVKLDKAWVVATPTGVAQLDGEVTFGGAWPALEVRGALDLVQGRYVGDVSSFSGANAVVVDQSIVVHRGSVAQEREEVVEEVPIYADFDVQVELDLLRNLDVRFAMPFIDDLGALGAAVTQANVEARVGGQVDVSLDGGDVAMLGEVEVLQGKVRVLRTQFEQLGGRIVFAGGEISEPNLDLEGQAIIPGQAGASGATITLRIAGTPSEPDIAFTSEEYGDNTQILTMLITGRAPESMSANEGMSTAQALAGLLLNSALSGTNLGNVSIDPSGSVSIGFPISERTYAVTRFNGRATPEQNRISVQLEWAMGPRLLWVLGAGEVYQWTDLVWERRF